MGEKHGLGGLVDKEIWLKVGRRGDESCDSGHCFSNAITEQVTASSKPEGLDGLHGV